jgi:hypothetical protein
MVKYGLKKQQLLIQNNSIDLLSFDFKQDELSGVELNTIQNVKITKHDV